MTDRASLGERAGMRSGRNARARFACDAARGDGRGHYLVGYGDGLERKRLLLDLEHAPV